MPVQTTRPAVLIRHSISDEELEMLKEGNRDGLSEAFWAFVAAALAALPAASDAIYRAYMHVPPEPLTPIHLAEVLIVFGCAVLAIAIRIIASRRSKRVRDLVADIRSRSAS